ncbi:MAG: hypothetical protein R3B06_13945 [Kofleriaceae bacterium]
MRWILTGVVLAAACKGDRGPSAPPAGGAAPTAPGPAVDAGPSPDAGPPLDAAVDAAASTAAPTPAGLTRVVIVHAPELLGSEQKGLTRLTATLARARPSVAVVEASADEAALARAWLDAPDQPTAPPPLPPAWTDAPVVVVVEALPPIGTKPKRTSGGLGGWLVFRPPAVAPVIVERGLGVGGALSDPDLAASVRAVITIAAGATP